LKETTLKFFAVGVVASPSAPWHIAHFALNVSAPGTCATALPAKEMARRMKAAFLNFLFIDLLRGPFNGRYITDICDMPLALAPYVTQFTVLTQI
jgi:hypothetical protein